MATARQVDANRRNAKKSTGPRTELGKAISGSNALRHGLTAQQHVVMIGEDPVAYDNLLLGMRRKYASDDPLVMQLVEQLAVLVWRLRRVPLLENALLSWLQRAELIKDKQMIGFSAALGPRSTYRLTPPSTSAGNGSATPGQDGSEFHELHSLGRTVQQALGDQDYLLKLSRYQTSMIRDFERALMQLHRIQDRERSAREATRDAANAKKSSG